MLLKMLEDVPPDQVGLKCGLPNYQHEMETEEVGTHNGSWSRLHCSRMLVTGEAALAADLTKTLFFEHFDRNLVDDSCW